MRKQLVLLLVVFLAVGNAVSLFAKTEKLRKPRFYIKVKGVASFSNGGDFGDFVDRNHTYFTNLNETDAQYDVTTVKDSYFQGFGGEIGIEVDKYAVGISVGYISRTFDVESHFDKENSDFMEDYTRTYSFSAVPIFFFLHYKVVNTRFLKAFLTIGEGVYLATYKDERAMTFEESNKTFANSYVKAHKYHLGFHAGVSFDFNITRNVALFVEAGYRLVSFKEIKADEFYEDDFQEELNEDQEFYYGISRITEEGRFTAGEGGGNFWDERLAELNMNGFCLNVGLKIIF
jgi:hypothetical protein